MKTIPDIIKEAGGAATIQDASNGKFKADAVYKWPSIGIPDRHWPLLMSLTKVTAEELFQANRAARAAEAERAS